jgi:hypothetical protein
MTLKENEELRLLKNLISKGFRNLMPQENRQ